MPFHHHPCQTASTTTMSGVDLDDLQAASANTAIPKDFDAATAPNAQEIEQQFAVVCMEFAEKHFKFITAIQPSKIPRFTQHDDEIYEGFLKAFPEYNDDERLKVVSEEEMKTLPNKRRWREFIMPFEKKVDDYNFGTLIRANCEGDYDQANSIFGVRLQFYAIEIARNRRKLNDVVWRQAKPDRIAAAKASS